ncbi:MAG: MFS transporter [Aquincola sp.]|nr:MFS transporter [Aquincola sp.]MDH5330201.1 MFS transporter [Aquincola sp.]
MIAGRALRGFVDGSVAVLLPAYLLALGHSEFEVGVIGTVTLAGSAIATLAVGAFGHRAAPRTLLLGAALLMMATGLGFAGFTTFLPLLVVAFVGTLNPGSGDVSVFLPLEHARLAGSGATSGERTTLFARYSLAGALAAALGALGAGAPDWLAAHAGVARVDALRGMFVAYAAIGLAIWALYRRLPMPSAATPQARPAPLGPSRGIVVKLAALFSVDAFAGGLVLNSLISLWLMQRFGLSLASAGLFFFATGLLGAASQLVAPWLARRIGLINTMVFTHLPANMCLVLAALAPTLPVVLALLGVRALLSQMDVPTRTAYVMSVVTPPERAAAASFTAVPRSLASAASPALAGALFAAGWLAAPMVLCGLLKIGYDLMLWRACRGQPLRGE